jgi:hypothetical protein
MVDVVQIVRASNSWREHINVTLAEVAFKPQVARTAF